MHPPPLLLQRKAIIAMNARVTGATPAVLNPPTLWNAEVISIAAPVHR